MNEPAKVVELLRSPSLSLSLSLSLSRALSPHPSIGHDMPRVTAVNNNSAALVRSIPGGHEGEGETGAPLSEFIALPNRRIQNNLAKSVDPFCRGSLTDTVNLPIQRSLILHFLLHPGTNGRSTAV